MSFFARTVRSKVHYCKGGAFTAAATTIIVLQQQQHRYCMEDDHNSPKEKPQVSMETSIIGNYENRIRKHSSPERVFEYFASVVINNDTFMTQEDFARAVTPFAHRPDEVVGSRNFKFNFSVRANRPTDAQREEYYNLLKKVLTDSRVSQEEVLELQTQQQALNIDYQAHLECLRELKLTQREFEALIQYTPSHQLEFFTMVDSDGDGLISYAEFMFFNTMLSLPPRYFEMAFKMFDRNSDGTIDASEFKIIMDMMRQKTPAGRQDRSLSKSSSVPIFKTLFGEDGTRVLTYERFKEFRQQLSDAVLRIQFQQYDVDDSNKLSAREFGMFLVSHVKQTDKKKWLARVERLSQMENDYCVSLQEFMDFNHFLEYLDAMKVAMSLVDQEHGGLDKDQFLRATRAATKGKFNLVSPLQVDLLFSIFDEDGNGKLDVNEFVDVMKTCKSGGFGEQRGLGGIDWMCKVWNCMKENW